MSLKPSCRCLSVASPVIPDRDQARLLRDEASRLRQQIKETSERLRTVNAEIAALQQGRSSTRLNAPPPHAQEALIRARSMRVV